MGSEGELKRGEASLIKLLPPPFIREGDKAGSQENQRFFWVLKGGRVTNKNLKGGEVDPVRLTSSS